MSAATAPERPRRRSGRLRWAALPLALVALGCTAQTAAAIPAADAQKPAVSDLPAAATQRAWALRLPSVERVVFRGGVSHDAAGIGTGSFLYPAPNAAGLLVAIIAHGFVSSGLRQKQKDQMQLEANRVLEPFEPVLSGFTHQQLMQAGLTRMSSQGGKRLLGAVRLKTGTGLARKKLAGVSRRVLGQGSAEKVQVVGGGPSSFQMDLPVSAPEVDDA